MSRNGLLRKKGNTSKQRSQSHHHHSNRNNWYLPTVVNQINSLANRQLRVRILVRHLVLVLSVQDSVPHYRITQSWLIFTEETEIEINTTAKMMVFTMTAGWKKTTNVAITTGVSAGTTITATTMAMAIIIITITGGNGYLYSY